jgi:hypothetical protein
MGSLSHIDGRWDRQASPSLVIWDSLAYGIQEVDRMSCSARRCFLEHGDLSISRAAASQSLVRLGLWKFLGQHTKFVQSILLNSICRATVRRPSDLLYISTIGWDVL